MKANTNDGRLINILFLVICLMRKFPRSEIKAIKDAQTNKTRLSEFRWTNVNKDKPTNECKK